MSDPMAESYRATIAKQADEIARLRSHEYTQPCGHSSHWLAYDDPMDYKSEQHCLFCEVERLRAMVKAKPTAGG